MSFMRNPFAVDLGVDLRALQPELAECKRRFQQDLWNTICNKVLQDNGWNREVSKEIKTDAKLEEDDEDVQEDNEEPDELEDSGNNSSTKRNRSNKDQQPPGGRPHLVRRSSRPGDPAPVPIQQNPIPRGWRVNSVHGGGGGAYLSKPHLLSRPGARFEQPASSNNVNSFLRHPQKPQQPPYNGELGKTKGSSRFIKKQPNPREQQRPLGISAGAAVHPADRARVFVQQQLQQFTHPRSHSATRRREILGASSLKPEPAATLDADDFLDASEAADPDGRVSLYDRDSGCRLTLNGAYSQVFSGGRDPELDSSSYLTPNPASNLDAGSNATREFVPLVVGDWLAWKPRMPHGQIF